QPAPDAVILDHDLLMLAAMDRIDGAADHAVSILARSARRGDEEVADAQAVADEARDRHAVRFGAVLLHAGFHALVTVRAFVKIHHEQTLSLIQTLFDIIAAQRSRSVAGAAVAFESLQRKLDQPF